MHTDNDRGRCSDRGLALLLHEGIREEHGFGLFLLQEILAITGISITENGEPGKGARFV